MVHGGAGRGQMRPCSPSASTAGDSDVPPSAARRWGRTPGGAEDAGAPWPGRAGPKRLGNARGQPPPSYILFHQRPASRPSAPEKFSKLSRCRPRPARDRERLLPLPSRQLDARGGAGPSGHRGRVALSRRRRGGRGAHSLRPGAAPAGSPPPQGIGELSRGCSREETGGGSRRRGGRWAGAGAGRARGGRRAAAGWRGAALRTRACSLPAPHLRPSAPTPFPSLGARGFKGPHIWGLRDAGKDASERGMVGGRGDQGRCAGEARGTSPLRTAGLGLSPRG